MVGTIGAGMAIGGGLADIFGGGSKQPQMQPNPIPAGVGVNALTGGGLQGITQLPQYNLGGAYMPAYETALSQYLQNPYGGGAIGAASQFGGAAQNIANQGFGNAGSVAANLLHEIQARVIAVSDSRASIFNNKGFNLPQLIAYKEKTGQVLGLPGSEEIRADELLALDCEILIPAALEDVIDGENAPAVKAKILAEAANGPVTPEGDAVLENKGVFVIPDILCNAGGVTVSYFEWVQDEQHLFWEAQDVYNRLERVMKTSFAEVLKLHLDRKLSMRVAANMLGIGRVAEAVKIRGLYP